MNSGQALLHWREILGNQQLHPLPAQIKAIPIGQHRLLLQLMHEQRIPLALKQRKHLRRHGRKRSTDLVPDSQHIEMMKAQRLLACRHHELGNRTLIFLEQGDDVRCLILETLTKKILRQLVQKDPMQIPGKQHYSEGCPSQACQQTKTKATTIDVKQAGTPVRDGSVSSPCPRGGEDERYRLPPDWVQRHPAPVHRADPATALWNALCLDDA